MEPLIRPSLLDHVHELDGLDPEIKQALAALLEVVSVRPGQRVQQAGEPWRGLFVVGSGRVRLVLEPSEAAPVTLDTLHEGASLGATSLFAEETAPYAVYAEQPNTTLHVLPREQVVAFFERTPELARRFRAFASERIVLDVLAASALFSTLSRSRVRRLVRSLQRRTLTAGERLIREGDEGDAVYIVEEGQLRVFRDRAPATTLHVAKTGDVVGEMALMGSGRRTANVEAETDASVLTLHRDDFLKLLDEERGLARSFDALAGTRRAALDAASGDGASGPAPPPTEPPAPTAPAGEEPEPPVAAPSDQEAVRIPLRHRLGFFPAVQQQSQMDCGAACLATVCRYYGKRVSLNQMRRLARVGQAGASMLNLKKAAQALGFETQPFLATYDQLSEKTLPAIANWRGYHWVVVYKVTPEQTTVADPGQGLRTMPRKEFEEGWTRYTLYLTPTAQVTEIEEERPALQQFFPYLRPHRRSIAEITLASFVMQILAVFVPLFSKFVLDRVIQQQDPQWLTSGVIALAFVLLGSTLIGYFRQNLLLYVSQTANFQMLKDFTHHVLHVPLRFFEQRKTGDITSRFQENQKLTSFLTEKGLQPFLDAFSIVVYFSIMLYFNVTLTVVVTLFLTLHIVNVYIISPRMQHAYRDLFQKGAESESYLIESIRGLGTVKTLGIERRVRWTWDNLNTRYLNAYFYSLKQSIGAGLFSGIVNSFAGAAVLLIGALMVLEGSLTIGELVAFQLILTSLTAPVMAVIGMWDEFQEALNGVERLNDVYETPLEIRSEDRATKVVVPRLRGALSLDDVTFRYYHDSPSNALQNVTLDIQPGQRIAFVGRSGSGKSTLIKLLMGFYQPTSGNVYVDGFNLADVWLPSFREQIGLVDQQTVLFQGTVRDNIALVRPDASMREVEEAAQRAHAHAFITALSEGYDTVLNENGSNLSGGQRQRLSLARTFLAQPRILILDEATSALDNESERLVQQNIEEAFGDRTVLMIAHRLSTVRHADRIVVLDRGVVLETGTHEELMAAGGLYYYLSTQQLDL